MKKAASIINPQKIVQEIERVSRIYFLECDFRLKQRGYNFYLSTGDNKSKAISPRRNSYQEIEVLKWFKDFWIYMEITFLQIIKNDFNILFSLSVFKGDISDNEKLPLFRAEWDNYDDNQIHPQPHWHFYSNLRYRYFQNDFSDFVSKEQSEFEQLLDPEVDTIDLNVSKMHFAMKAIWEEGSHQHIHKIKNEADFIKWYQGLLNHLKAQLEFVI